MKGVDRPYRHILAVLIAACCIDYVIILDISTFEVRSSGGKQRFNLTESALYEESLQHGGVSTKAAEY